jgi:hypothetical protein
MLMSKTAVLVGFLSKVAVCLSFSFLQQLRDDLSCDSYCYGKLQSYKAALSFMCVLLIGLLSDYVEKRIVIVSGLVVSLVCYVACYSLLHTHHIAVLYLHIIPYSILYQNISLLKAIFADSFFNQQQHQQKQKQNSGKESGSDCDSGSDSDCNSETAIMGYLGMSAAASYMLGPLIGSSLFSSFGTSLRGSIMLVLLALLLVYQSLWVQNNGGMTSTVTATVDGMILTPAVAGASPLPLPHKNNTQKAQLPSLCAIRGQMVRMSSGAKLLLLVRMLMSFGNNIK